MTPAIDLLKQKKIAHTVHAYKHDPRHNSYGLEAAERLGFDANNVFKTLMFCINGEAKNLAVAIIPVASKLNLKYAAKAMKAKKAEMADPAIAQKTSGYLVGGISPLAQKKALPTFLHHSAQGLKTIYISAGKRGLDLEIAPDQILLLTRGAYVALTV